MDGPAASRIRFAGWVAGEEKRQLIRAAALFASPSSQENFGLAAVEAMAAGVPVLIGAGVNLAPDVQDAGAGWIVPADGAIAPVLRTVLSEDTLRAVRGRAARRLAQRFTWANSTAALLAAYRDVLQRDRGGAAA
jgi:glycosyltransferase involved in cell wall biosynthesis